MRRLILSIVAGLFAVAWFAAPAHATTKTPCVRHDANPPAVSYIGADGSHLAGSGGIGGCPSGTGSVSGTVQLQHLDPAGNWATDSTVSYAKSWSPVTRTARQASNIANGFCQPGATYRTHVTGGDGFQPTSWDSTTVTFAGGESQGPGGCFYGGGD